MAMFSGRDEHIWQTDLFGKAMSEEYVLVDSRMVRMEIYRKEGRGWLYESFQGGDDVVLAYLNVQFPLAAAYEDVFLTEEEIIDEEEEDEE